INYWSDSPKAGSINCDLRYQGQIFDSESGLYYNRYRYYCPELCQYISPDPIGLAGGLRPQGYVHNPMDWVDPFGLNTDEITFKESFRQAKRNLNIPKNVNTPTPIRVWDSQYENRTVWAFDGEHKGKFIVMHDEDKFGRGKHLHTATSMDGRVDPTEPGK
ncbi:RHS repeat-associated core domain-containing protein, partial [Motilimonas sp. E26]|uniref:RHS repeat-associated core domain-containing protein n=1 Tax=Motilimonas sp. E26 TaxID=2865674 RepID=UPI001E5C2DF8